MKDTSLKNTLFQAEFNTDLQLADVMRFIKDRHTIEEFIASGGYSPVEIVDALVELGKDNAVAVEMYQRGILYRALKPYQMEPYQ